MWMEQKEWEELRTGPPRLKLHLDPFNSSIVNGKHNGEMVGRGKRNRKMA